MLPARHIVFVMAIAASAYAPVANAGQILYTTFDPAFPASGADPATSAFPVGVTLLDNCPPDCRYVHRAIAVPFQPSESAALGTVKIAYGNDDRPGTTPPYGGVEFSIASDSRGLPGSILETFDISGPLSGGGGPLTSADSILRPILTAGERYWLIVTATPILQNNAAYPDYEDAKGGSWLVNSIGYYGTAGSPFIFASRIVSQTCLAGSGVNCAQPFPLDTNWHGSNAFAAPAFQIESATPEPSTSVLLALVFGTVGIVRCRRRAARRGKEPGTLFPRA